MNLKTTTTVLPYLVRLYIKTRLEYRGGYILGLVAQFFSYVAAYSAIWIILYRFENLGGWNWPQLALLLSFQLLAYSCGAAFSLTQFRDLEDLTRSGNFDSLLVKPFSPWAYIAFSGLNIGYAGHIVLGVGLMAWALSQVGIDWSLGTVLFGVAALLSASMLTAAIITILGASSLVLVRSRYLFSIYFGFWELSRYPLSIFPAALQILLYTIVPMGFTAYVPVAWLLGKDVPLLGAWAGPLAILAGPAAVLLAMAHWRFCIRRYQGAGG